MPAAYEDASAVAVAVVTSPAPEALAPYSTIPRDPEEVERGRALGPANTPARIYEILRKALAKESQEVFLVLPLDLRGFLLCRPVEIARGQRDHVEVDPSDIYRPVHFHNAKGFVVVHVHPSGHAKPSQPDRDLTKTIEKGTETIWEGTVKFVDHVVIAAGETGGEYFSFRENPDPKKKPKNPSRSSTRHALARALRECP